MSAPYVWQLSPDESTAAGVVLAAAFMDEPLLLATFPDLDRREAYFQQRFAAVTRLACQVGEAWAVGSTHGEVAGVALWFREPSLPPTPELKAALGFPDDPIGDETMGQVMAMVARAEAGLGEMPPVWRELAMLAIAPDRQGAGLGSVLVRHVLADAAAAGEVVGLVTTRAVNVPFYERAGLDLVWQGTSEDGVVPLWSFRTPAP